MTATDMTGRQRDYSKLPKWAQEHIERLERANTVLRRALEKGPEDSDTVAIHGLHTEAPIGKGIEIEYKIEGRRAFSVHLDGEELVVLGENRFTVAPHSSNHIRIKLVGR